MHQSLWALLCLPCPANPYCQAISSAGNPLPFSSHHITASTHRIQFSYLPSLIATVTGYHRHSTLLRTRAELFPSPFRSSPVLPLPVAALLMWAMPGNTLHYCRRGLPSTRAPTPLVAPIPLLYRLAHSKEERRIGYGDRGEVGGRIDGPDMWGPLATSAKTGHYTAKRPKLTRYCELWDGLYLLFQFREEIQTWRQIERLK